MLDYVKVSIRSGKGGNGSTSFRRERFIPMGGPDGGDGSKGGDVYMETDTNMNTLEIFNHNQKLWAENGKPGRGKKMFGLKGEDLVIKVPLGTVVRLRRIVDNGSLIVDKEKVAVWPKGKVLEDSLKSEDSMEKVIDFDKPKMRILIARGGRGGRGNVHFKSSRNTTPMTAEMGGPSEDFEATMELKLLADVGLIGLPNAGKSTLLSVLSNAKPKVADYEFTTLEPNLGVLKVKDKSLVIADIPGLIEGASEGKGLGIQFLRHIERTTVLVHLISVLEVTPEKAYENYLTIRKELELFGENLAEKKEIVVLSKVDLVGEADLKQFKNYFKKKKIEVSCISVANGVGVEELKLKVLHTGL